jgi:outer membrane protein assembly factor BamB
MRRTLTTRTTVSIRTLAALTLGFGLYALTGCETTTNTNTNDVDLAEAQNGQAVTMTESSDAASSDAASNDDTARTVTGGFTIEHNNWKQLGYRWDWTGFPAIARGEAVAFFDVYDDIAVVQGSQSSVAVLNALSGRPRWSDRLSNPLTRFVGMTRDGDTLYISADSELFIIDARTGNWLGRDRLPEVVNTRPILFEGHLIYGTATGRVISHRLDFGMTAWQYNVGDPINANPVLIGSVIGIMSESGEGLFVSAATATGLGHPQTGGGQATDPVTDGRRMYLASLDQSAYAFIPGQDAHLWRYRTEDELTTQPTLEDGVLYLSVPRVGLVALDPNDGSEIWIGPDAEGEVIASRAGSLIVWDGNAIKAVDPTNGDVITAFDIPGIIMLKADAFNEGSLYGITRAGAVVRMSPR